MRVFYRGFNLYNQFPYAGKLVETFIDHSYDNLTKIEVTYYYVVLLAADTIQVKGANELNLNVSLLDVGCNEDKIVGVSKQGDLVKITDTLTVLPRLQNLEDDDGIRKISVGGTLTVALTRKGRVYNVPNELEYRNDKIIDVRTGREHCLLLDSEGNVFSFGGGSRGQLGHGTLENEEEPKFIEALGGIFIKAIAVGGWHSCGLSRDGDLYVWGWNSNGQLGIDVVSVMATPHVLDVELNFAKIACGVRHTLTLTEDKKLFGCGWNKYKQLTNDTIEECRELTCLASFIDEEVEELRCGPWNSLVVVKENKMKHV